MSGFSARSFLFWLGVPHEAAWARSARNRGAVSALIIGVPLARVIPLAVFSAGRNRDEAAGTLEDQGCIRHIAQGIFCLRDNLG